jgi:GGDEF domain-containing protein
MKLLNELAGDIGFAVDHIEKAARLDYIAYYDVLTDLANRSLFLERVGQYMRSASSGGHKLAVLLLDLERFKNINDSLGQAAGDALLKQVADWLAALHARRQPASRGWARPVRGRPAAGGARGQRGRAREQAHH